MRASMQDIPEMVLKLNKEDVAGRPVIFQAVTMGEMIATFASFPKGADISEPFTGMTHDKCPVPHWEYVLTGKMRVEYPDGDEFYSAGDIFYMPPYHMPYFEEDTQFIEFSPKQELDDLFAELATRGIAVEEM